MNNRTYRRLFAALACLASAFLTNCSSTKSTTHNQTFSLAATSGSGQSATDTTAFSAPLTATVTSNGSPASGVTVTFTAPSSGASGTFATGSATATATTDANGVATSSAFTANGTAGTYSVTASVAGATSPASFSLTNTAPIAYAFYASGLETINGGYNYYALAGAVALDTNGNVLGGEQDYNDAYGVTSPQPSGDSITGGTLTIDSSTGQGTLTLITNNTALGVSGTETLGVQFVNASHALIVQLDGSASSSGSMDLQNLASAPSGSYAFSFNGYSASAYSNASGGVFSVSGTSISAGTADVVTESAVATGNSFTGTLSAPDAYGRGTITGMPSVTTLNYYLVGPEAMRVINMDASDAEVGSAFGQGSATFSDASLGSSVLALGNYTWDDLDSAVGMLATTPGSPSTFTGIEDDFSQTGTMAGNYAIAGNGYGSLSFTSGGPYNVSPQVMGVYMTDPALSLTDPNNPAGGGGALVVSLSNNFLAGGIGVLVPQTDTATSSFAGNYAFGIQSQGNGEFDFIGQGSVTTGALSGTGLLSDPFAYFASPGAEYTGLGFSGTATPDGANPGRYTMSSLDITAPAGTASFDIVEIYQASGGQLFWQVQGSSAYGFGSFQQQGSLTGVPAARRRLRAHVIRNLHPVRKATAARHPGRRNHSFLKQDASKPH